MTVIRTLLGVLFWLMAVGAAIAQVPQRVVTVNLCLDQMAMRLAAPGQLVGVSYLSRDPRISVLADRAASIPTVRATVESILALRPDLVIFDRDSHATLKRLLRGADIRMLEVPWGASIADAETIIERMSIAMGREEIGKRLIADMREQKGRLAWTGAPVATAITLQANRGTAGKGSLMGELLGVAGFRNLAAELGIPAYGRIALEEVLVNQPGLLVLDGATNANPARATEFVDHHALLALAGKTRLLSLPMKYAICAGPENFEAIRLLVEARP
jgi:iron complex transport system substrate-binding protein